MSEILNKGKAWSSWKTAEYKPSSPEPSKMAANRTSDDFGSIKTPLIAVCPWKFNKLIWLKDTVNSVKIYIQSQYIDFYSHTIKELKKLLITFLL